MKNTRWVFHYCNHLRAGFKGRVCLFYKTNYDYIMFENTRSALLTRYKAGFFFFAVS